MPDFIDAISDYDDQEAARIRRVGTRNQRIFPPLRSALKELVSKYNTRHPVDGVGFTPAMVFADYPLHNTNCGFTVAKNIEPKRLLSLSFDINSGQMEYKCVGGSDPQEETIRLDIKDDTPMFFVGGNRHSAVTLAEELLRSLFGRQGRSKMIPSTPQRTERELIEALALLLKNGQGIPGTDGYVRLEQLCSQTSFGRSAHLKQGCLDFLKGMEPGGLVLVKVLGMGEDAVVKLGPEGMSRLRYKDDGEYFAQMRLGVQTISNVFHGDVHQFAQTTGSNSPVNQHLTVTDIKSILPLIDRLLEEVRNHPELPEDTEVDVEQVRLEAKRSHPSLQRINERLESVKRVGSGVVGIVQLVSQIVQMIHSHSGSGPGVP